MTWKIVADASHTPYHKHGEVMTAEIAKTIQLFYEKSQLEGEPHDWLNDAANEEEFNETAYGLVGDYEKLKGIVMVLVTSGVVSRDELLGAIECVESQRGKMP